MFTVLVVAAIAAVVVVVLHVMKAEAECLGRGRRYVDWPAVVWLAAVAAIFAGGVTTVVVVSTTATASQRIAR